MCSMRHWKIFHWNFTWIFQSNIARSCEILRIFLVNFQRYRTEQFWADFLRFWCRFWCDNCLNMAQHLKNELFCDFCWNFNVENFNLTLHRRLEIEMCLMLTCTALPALRYVCDLFTPKRAASCGNVTTFVACAALHGMCHFETTRRAGSIEICP